MEGLDDDSEEGGVGQQPAPPIPPAAPAPAPNAGPAPVHHAPGWAIMEEVGRSWRFVAIDDQTKPVGRMHYIKRSVKATCSLHRQCACHVTIRDDLQNEQAVVATLKGWLNDGYAHRLSPAAHSEESLRIRRDVFHMKTRAR
eukprot:11173161-Lingulodinium_polyedra.AAC.1